MEQSANLMKKESLTRLQKQAPSCLVLDKVVVNGCSAKLFAAQEAATVIPLLSPLVLSPQPLAAETITLSENNGNRSFDGCGSSSMPASTGWQHPAMSPFSESNPSTLFTLFQRQCVIVNHAQALH